LKIAFIPIEAGNLAQIEHVKNVYAGHDKCKSVLKVVIP
jgi:hypothetical protein